MDTTELSDGLPDMIVLLFERWRKMINKDHDENSYQLYTCQHFEDSVKSVNSAIQAVAANTHATMMHREM